MYSRALCMHRTQANVKLDTANADSVFIELYTYDAIGELTKKTQRTGSVHQYANDSLGRMTSDNVITLGSGVSGSIRRLDYSFDTGGRLYQATSFSNTSGATVVNQIQRDYNGLGQLTREWQAHSGTVNTSAGTSQTASIQYTYSELANGTNAANHSRLTGIIYPTTNRTVVYDYSGAGGIDNAISRLSGLMMGTNTLESYDYLGLGTVVKKAHQNGVDLTYESSDSLAGSDGGDQYTGLDRFGRIIDQNYLNTGTSGGSTDRFQYGYDTNSNVTFKNNLGPGTSAASFSELYHANGTNGYDQLNRLVTFRRGVLSKSGGSTVYDTVTTANASHTWNMDTLGNWANSSSGGTNTVNAQNQYTSVANMQGSNTVTSSFSYDNDGNLTSRPDSADSGLNDTFTYDAWDRMASFTHTIYVSNNRTEQDYNIDALGRRAKVSTTQTSGPINTDELFYSAQWQVLEDDRTLNGGTLTKSQYIWSPTYVNDLVLRDRDINHNGNFDERIYVQQDANHNVTAITDINGNVLERFIYDPYGAPTVKSASWGSASDSKDWLYLFQGGRWDQYTRLLAFQNRLLDVDLGRWTTQDPNGTMYVDGGNLYQFVTGNPVNRFDPSGLKYPGISEIGNTPGVLAEPPPPAPESAALNPGDFGFNPIILPPDKEDDQFAPLEGLQRLGIGKDIATGLLRNAGLHQGCISLFTLIEDRTGTYFRHGFKTAKEANLFKDPNGGPTLRGVLQIKIPFGGDVRMLENGEVDLTMLTHGREELTWAVMQPDCSFISMDRGGDPEDQHILVRREQWGKQGEITIFVTVVRTPRPVNK